MRYDGKRVLIVGLGESGKAAVRFFAARGARVVAADLRSASELGATVAEMAALGAQLRLGGHPPELFAAQDLVVPSPGVPWNLPELEAARRQGIAVAGELEIAAGELKGPVIGVTGSNGKTTTTSLIAHLLRTGGLDAETGGNIGKPVLSMAGGSAPDRWHVLELSSFQLEAMHSFRCHIAAVLNVTPDHLDRHGDFASYAAAKARIFEAQRPEDWAVLNANDAVCRGYAEAAKSQVVWFSRLGRRERGAWAESGAILLDGRRIAGTGLPIKGAHNLENALAAVSAASLAGVGDEDLARGLAAFQPVEHRLEFVRELDGVSYYNDSKATNVDAAVKALEAFGQGVWIVLGGRDKGGDYRPLAAAGQGKVRRALLIGEAAGKIRARIGGMLPLEDCGVLEAAVDFARAHAPPGDTVLLAPACASFDQFESYAHRGREFKRLVMALGKEAETRA